MSKPIRFASITILSIALGASQAVADMTGGWTFTMSSGHTFRADLTETGGEISGNVAVTGQRIIGRVQDGGFVFGRWGGGLKNPQFYGGKLSDNGDKLTGSFCHEHSDCSATFTAARQ